MEAIVDNLQYPTVELISIEEIHTLQKDVAELKAAILKGPLTMLWEIRKLEQKHAELLDEINKKKEEIEDLKRIIQEREDTIQKQRKTIQDNSRCIYDLQRRCTHWQTKVCELEGRPKDFITPEEIFERSKCVNTGNKRFIFKT